MTIDVTLACHDYAWTNPLWTGQVEPEGVNLSTVDYPNPQRFTRMVRHLEFDACELSLGTYLASRSNPARFPFTALPVFPFRKFRHAYMFKRSGASIESITDLEGKRVGIVNWQTTTGIWQRGILRERYGLETSKVHWVAAGSEIIDIEPPADNDVKYLNRQQSTIGILEGMLERGEIDAIFHPVATYVASAESLFEDPKAIETHYYRETAIFPIMHTIVLKNRVLEDHPWIVQKLYDAFEEAKHIGLNQLNRPRELPLVWADIHVEEQRRVLGDDPWEYGLTAGNTKTIEKLVEYAHNQGVSPERYEVETLFASEYLHDEWYG